MFVLKSALVLTALGAVSIGPVPLEWVGLSLLIVYGVAKMTLKAPGGYIFIAFVIWALFVQAVNIIGCASYWNCASMPEGATTSYPVYVALRFFVLIAFFFAIGITAKLIDKGRREEIIDFVVKLGVLFSGIALYVYIAQMSGLPDIPRNRLGTDGKEVEDVAFTYAFHRALGTFREPSHLAVWLVLPFFLSLRSFNWRPVLIGSTILLTGSLTGFVAIAIGAVAAWAYLLIRGTRGNMWLVKLPLVAGAIVFVSLPIFYLLAQGDTDIATVIYERVAPIFQYGITESNRGYVYQYAIESDIPIIGAGIGDASLYLTRWMRLDVMAGFLSLYLNVLFSLGVVGLVLLGLFLLKPMFMSTRALQARESFALFAAYFAWLVIFTAHASELPTMFAITYVLLVTHASPS